MHYKVANLGQAPKTECTGDVCYIKKPGTMGPGRVVGRSQAFALANLLSDLISSNPGCFEGEDLSVAYAMEQRLRAYGKPVLPGTFQTQEMLNLSDDEDRVLTSAESCSRQPQMQPFPHPVEGQPSVIETMENPANSNILLPNAPFSPAPSSFPVVPVAIGAGALGLVALIVSLAK